MPQTHGGRGATPRPATYSIAAVSVPPRRTPARRCRSRSCPWRTATCCPVHAAAEQDPRDYPGLDRMMRERPYVGPIRAGVTG